MNLKERIRDFLLEEGMDIEKRNVAIEVFDKEEMQEVLTILRDWSINKEFDESGNYTRSIFPKEDTDEYFDSEGVCICIKKNENKLIGCLSVQYYKIGELSKYNNFFLNFNGFKNVGL